MLAIIIPALVIVICSVVISRKCWGLLYDWCLTTLIISAIYCFFMVFLGTVGYFESKAFVAEFKAVGKIVKAAPHIGGIIPAAEANGDLAKWKYYNSVYVFSPWVTDEVDELKPIEHIGERLR